MEFRMHRQRDCFFRAGHWTGVGKTCVPVSVTIRCIREQAMVDMAGYRFVW